MSTINGRACVANGRNLIIQSDLKIGYINPSTGVQSSSDDFYSDNYIPTNGATVFTFSSPDYVFKGNGDYDRIIMYDSNKNVLGSQPLDSPTQTLSKPNVAYIRFSINAYNEGNTTGNASNWLSAHRYKLEKGSVATPLNPAPVDKVFSNGVQIYGRNLYTDTQNFDNLASWNVSINWEKTKDTYNGLAVVQKTQPWNGLSQYIQVKKGDILTYSVYAKYVSGTQGSTIYWILNGIEGSYSSAGVSQFSTAVTITDSWQRVSGTTVTTSDGYLRPRLEKTDTNTNTLQIAGIKVEKGSVATPCTPAPEDVM